MYPFRQRKLEKAGNKAELIDPDKPHPQELCEMCQRLGFYCGKLRGVREEDDDEDAGQDYSDDDDDDDYGWDDDN